MKLTAELLLTWLTGISLGLVVGASISGGTIVSLLMFRLG